MPHQPEHWADSFAIARMMFEEAGVEIVIKT
jgi:hypothetical protein